MCSSSNSHRLALLVLLDRLELEKQRRDEGANRTGQRNVVGILQALHVRLKHGLNSILAAHLGQDLSRLRCAAVDEDVGVDANVVLLNLRDEAVLEDSLRDGNEDGAAESLEELDAGRADGNPFLREDGLDDNGANLEAGADAQASEDLVAEPLAQGRVDVKGGDQARTDAEEHHAGDDDVVVLANGRDEASRDDGADDGGEEERKNLDACLDGANTLNGLEVES